MSDILIIVSAVVFAIAMGLIIFRISIWLTDRKSTEQLGRDADKIDDTRSIKDGFMF
ncbi:hypothetical protein [Parasphingorhabdus sp.]|uniref:hypothetical protein n=1 Tax=Parasphingorhabdus sp. TaxID=2709688 RepID=UPI003D2DFE1E